MDWANSNHLLQALLVCACVVVFCMGYASGDKT